MLAFLSFLCGTTIRIKLEVIGEIYLIEPLLILLALQCLLSRGLGKGFVAPVFLGFVASGMVTFCGYLFADLIANNEPWQYLKGWGRVGLLILDVAAFMLLAAHGKKNIWWLALGAGLGGIASLLIEGVPIEKWKLGYGEYVAILVLTLAPLAPRLVAAILVAGFGVYCIAVDYRSLGATCLIIAPMMVLRTPGKQGAKLSAWLRAIAATSVAAAAIMTVLISTQEQYSERRFLSNIGRRAQVDVAWQAIRESPWIGYGSWAASEKYGRMLRDQMLRDQMDNAAEGAKQPRVRSGKSLLPHSQFLQAWVEGGLLGIAFFLLYGVGLVWALRWFAWCRNPDPIGPICLFFLVGGLWNLMASPFLGLTRVYIAMAVAVIAIAAYERKPAAAARPAVNRGWQDETAGLTAR